MIKRVVGSILLCLTELFLLCLVGTLCSYYSINVSVGEKVLNDTLNHFLTFVIVISIAASLLATMLGVGYINSEPSNSKSRLKQGG
jgi:hypothetical protein